MSEFTLFNEALKQFEENKEVAEEHKESLCSHINIVSERGSETCADCGEEIQNKIDNTKEWRYYGQSDTKHMSDPTRVQMRKMEDRSIFKDVENLGFSETIIAKANKIYLQVTQGKIRRGNSRKGIVFASIFHAFKSVNNPQSHDTLMKTFGLSRKEGLHGLKQVSQYAPKHSKLRTTYISPINLIGDILKLFSASKEQEQEVIDLYTKTKGKSFCLNRSRPQSVASGVVYFWIRLKNKDITLKDFAKKVLLSELTINKIAKEIAKVLGMPNIV